MQKESGIYTITNITNNKIYVGSAADIKKRWREHKWGLIHNKHRNSYLQRAWNKYGESNFVFEILENYPDEGFILSSMEHYWCNLLLVHNDKYGYNIRPTNPYGRPKQSEESKKKFSASRTGYIMSEETKEKIRKTKLESPYITSKETRKKISNKHKGHITSEETKRKIGNSNKGKYVGRALSEETKLKISVGMKKFKNKLKDADS